MVSLLVTAAGTDTVFIACAPSSKAFTIQFQTVYFCTFAALMAGVIFFLLCVHVPDAVDPGKVLYGGCWHGWGAMFVQ